MKLIQTIWNYVLSNWNLHNVRNLGKNLVIVALITIMFIVLGATKCLIIPSAVVLVVGVLILLISVFMEGSQ